MADPIHLPRKQDNIDRLVDLYIDASIDLEEAVLHEPTNTEGEVIHYLRVATALANEVAGISGLYERSVYPC